MIDYSVVIPTLGRPCLRDCLTALAAAGGPGPRRVVLVDDRPAPRPGEPLPQPLPTEISGHLPGMRVLHTGGRGPAAARNCGWRATDTPWVVFLDDDVRVSPGWADDLVADLTGPPDQVAGVQAVLEVPLPAHRRPTDWERGTAGLAGCSWITADMAYRRAALAESGGFDERFPRAFREDADLALRLLDQGWRLTRGRRRTVHPVRPASPWISVRTQAGNRDDALMRALHGRGWYERAGAEPGRRSRHLAVTAAALAAAGLSVTGRRRAALPVAAAALAGVAEFAAARILPGPRTAREVAVMAATSVAIPPVASWHWLHGRWTWRAAAPWPPQARAVLFDRDDTLIRDVPYNGDPSTVQPMPGALEAVRLARRHGLLTGVVSNQSGIARGLLTDAQVAAVNEQVNEVFGRFDTWQVCPHGPDDGCGCRKPRPGMVAAAAAELGLSPHECVVIGDIGADVGAARAAGARAVLVPTGRTLPAELAGARIAGDLVRAVEFVLGRDPGPPLWRTGPDVPAGSAGSFIGPGAGHRAPAASSASVTESRW